MKVELIIPIDSLRGKLRQDGFYFRKYRGQQIVQKCPDRSKHVKTEDEAANQRRFAATSTTLLSTANEMGPPTGANVVHPVGKAELPRVLTAKTEF